MSTSTQNTNTTTVQNERTVITTGSRTQNWLLVLLVFIGGICSLGVEMAASRLLAPYFGTSQFVWANLIGLILLYLTIGYYVGGRLADRYPSHTVIYSMTAVAAILTAAIPVFSKPILEWSLSAFATYSVGVFYGSLVSVIFLFAIPMILLGCISPYAIRLRVEQVGKSGRIAGLLYAISTAGSIIGTFATVLLLIPNIGTRYTFVTLGTILLAFAIIGLIVTGSMRKAATGNETDETERPEAPKKFNKGLLSLLLILPLLATTLGVQGHIKRPSGTGDGGILLTERESFYNYIQVVRSENETQLILNEGLGIHSIYNPDQVLTRGPWDYFLVAPYFNNAPYTEQQVKNVCIIGLGAGTIPRGFTSAYGSNVHIDGVEIDGEIVNLARQYFKMDEPNLNVIVQDGRYHIRTTQQRYDLIGLDAYQQPYIPFQLTSVEFLHELQARLTDNGVVVMNVGRTNTDYRLVSAMAENLKTVFPNVYLVDSERFSNTLLIATNQHTSLNNFATNSQNLQNPLLKDIADHAIQTGNIREEEKQQVHFTDDLAPIEQLIDTIIFSAVEQGK